MAGDFEALERTLELVDQVAARMAATDGLVWDEKCCGEERGDPCDCDSGTCIAAHHEDHDPDMARSYYRSHAKIALSAARSVVVNSPETADFMAGVPLEAAHQRERWPSEHDAGKAPEDWLFLIGYLAGKACAAARSGDTTKALHHTISSAAALANWHAALTGRSTAMRPGIAEEARP